jgi:hypothetical protein
MVRTIRGRCSEHIILRVKDAVDGRVDRVERRVEALSERLGVDPLLSARQQRRKWIAALRRLLDHDAKECELQDALLHSGLLDLTCKVIQEVVMKPTENHPGMRMDLVLGPDGRDPAQIIELKRGSHLLLARQGKPTARLSQGLMKAVKQVRKYGQRLESDVKTAKRIEQLHGLTIDGLELRLVAGRRLRDADGYSFLSLAESDAGASALQLQIYTWDGFLAELEVIAG